MPIRVILRHGHKLLREALRDALAAQEGLEVVGDSADVTLTAAQSLAARAADVLVLQIPAAQVTSAASSRHLRGLARTTTVIALVENDRTPCLRRLLHECGVVLLPAETNLSSLVEAIRATAAKRLSCQLAGAGAASSAAPTRARPHEGVPAPALSERERELLLLVAKAMSNRQIATELNIAEGTVKRHMRNIFRKLGALSRLDAVNKGVAAALIPVPRPPSLSA